MANPSAPITLDRNQALSDLGTQIKLRVEHQNGPPTITDPKTPYEHCGGMNVFNDYSKENGCAILCFSILCMGWSVGIANYSYYVASSQVGYAGLFLISVFFVVSGAANSLPKFLEKP